MQPEWVGLATRAKDGDKEAFTRLVERFKRPICAAIHPIVEDWHMTQDVAQDTFVAAYRQLPSLREPRCFRSWLFRIARNQAVNRIRTHMTMRTRSLETVSEDEILGMLRGSDCILHDGRGELAPSAEALARVRKVVMALPNGYGSVLVMRYVEGMSVTELSDCLGRTKKAVKALLYRARGLARDYLDKAGLDKEKVMHEM